MQKPKLKILVGLCSHFLKWELPHFENFFEIVDEPASDTILLAFGPDVLDAGAKLPALKRVALSFPGFGRNPYHNIEYRRDLFHLVSDNYDLLFVNPGPLEVAFYGLAKLVVCPFSIDTYLVHLKRCRHSIRSLLHVSADYPQKDWRRSEAVMKYTGLKMEVFPPREIKDKQFYKLRHSFNKAFNRIGVPWRFNIPPEGYFKHKTVVRKYHRFDAFVHVAAEVNHYFMIDGKYTASLLEAGATGAILFWHDTLNLGNSLETVFNLSLEPKVAAEEILQIARNINIEKHSKLTSEEIHDKFNPSYSVGIRARKMLGLL